MVSVTPCFSKYDDGCYPSFFVCYQRWDRLKRIMGDATLCQRIESLDVSTVPVEAAQAAQTAMKDLTAGIIKSKSYATFCLFEWVS